MAYKVENYKLPQNYCYTHDHKTAVVFFHRQLDLLIEHGYELRMADNAYRALDLNTYEKLVDIVDVT